ncbi:MAG TPA: metallophosphoesterase [Syntrophales bacterium]|mgnify:FL=1|nr:metallophosphoesterase [Syntrophales bacterium]
MKIIYLADVHGDFPRVKDLLAVTDAQVYIVAGDLIDRPFFTEEMAARYRELQSYFFRLQCRMGDGGTDMDDFVEDLLRQTDLPNDILANAREYQEKTVRARRVLQQKYKVLETILSLKRNSLIFCLPGNYDMDLQYTSLHSRDLHRHWYYVADLRIAGYGGADVATPGIPHRYAVPYNADRGMSEMYRFFKETRPDIVVTHKPAHGVHDRVLPMGESGSLELRRFCEENHVPLCLTGHIHEQWGFEEIEGTVYLNPSNFGEVPEPGGRVAEGGFFYDIETKGRQIARVTLSKLVGRTVHQVAVYARRKGAWTKYVLDPERFGALLRGKNHDRRETPCKDRHVEIKKNMKWFFPGSATDGELQAVLGEINHFASDLKYRFEVSLSADFLGDVHGPDSPPSPPLDIILYLRCGSSPGPPKFQQKDNGRPRCLEVVEMTRSALSPHPYVRVADWVDLDVVSRSLAERDYECDALLRFAAYRVAGGRILNDGAASVERELDADRAFRGEVEGTGHAYMEIFRNVAERVENMKVFETRLRELGIAAPEAFKIRIRECFYGGRETKDKEDH